MFGGSTLELSKLIIYKRVQFKVLRYKSLSNKQ